jgi:hypothetical protein
MQEKQGRGLAGKDRVRHRGLAVLVQVSCGALPRRVPPLYLPTVLLRSGAQTLADEVNASH